MTPTIADLTRARDIAARNFTIAEAQWQGKLPGALYRGGSLSAARILGEARDTRTKAQSALDAAERGEVAP